MIVLPAIEKSRGSRAPMRMLGAIALLATLVPWMPRSTRASEPANAGFLYGRVTTESQSEYEGYLRWGRQESFWDDLFHSLKTELPYVDEVDEDVLRGLRKSRNAQLEILGLKLRWSTDDIEVKRLFICRFGDIARIEVQGEDEAVVEVRDGARFEVAGYSDDVSSEVRVRDMRGGEIGIAWKRIETIEFSSAPPEWAPPAGRLYGEVKTSEGPWVGYVMWDKEECLTTDLLDGDSRDGEVSLEMGQIRRIERRGRSSSRVELIDGRKMRLRGTNDVDDDNRGIMVEVAGLGRVTVDWSSFESFTRQDAPGSGRGYDSFENAGPLSGEVLTTDGRTFAGRLVLDLDESESWEILNGSTPGLSFDIPLANVASLQRKGEEACVVTLRDDRRLVLEAGQDVTARNAGILIYAGDDSPPTYVSWDSARDIRLRR